MTNVALAGGTLLLLLGSLTSCATEQPSVSAFCAANDRAPKDDDLTVTEARAIVADLERVSPPEIRDEVMAMRKALEAATTVIEVEAFYAPGGRVKAEWDRYHEYSELNCGFD